MGIMPLHAALQHGQVWALQHPAAGLEQLRHTCSKWHEASGTAHSSDMHLNNTAPQPAAYTGSPPLVWMQLMGASGCAFAAAAHGW